MHAARSDRIARARQLQPSLNAFVALREPASPECGPLNGTPYAAKDMFAAPDRVPHGGLSRPLPPLDCGYADVLRRLDEAGADRIGYTAMTELAYEPSGFNAIHGRVRNPWNLDFIPGGSSSGSAAAVASGAVKLALGSDTGGSLRIPAHCCGITAWKPTYGVVSARGAMPLAPTLDTIGLLAQGAADILPALDVLAQLPYEDTPTRGGVVIRDALAFAHPAVRRACQDGIDAIEACGVALEPRDALPLLEAADAPFFTIIQGEAVRAHRVLLDQPLDPMLRQRLEKGLAIGDAALAAAIAQRPVLASAFTSEVLQGADAAILPVMAIRTPPAEECDPNDPAFRARTLYELSRLTRYVNMLGLPAVALPVGLDDRGLPVGLQVVGRPGSDGALLRLAAAVQSRTGWHGRMPAALSSIGAVP